jgi:hypothetical protein
MPWRYDLRVLGSQVPQAKPVPRANAIWPARGQVSTRHALLSERRVVAFIDGAKPGGAPAAKK